MGGCHVYAWEHIVNLQNRLMDINQSRDKVLVSHICIDFC